MMVEYRCHRGRKFMIVPGNSGGISKEVIESGIISVYNDGGEVKEILSDKIEEIKALYSTCGEYMINPLGPGTIKLVERGDNMDMRIYKDFDEDNIITSADVTRVKYRSIDFGYYNPFVCLFITVDGDGNVVIYDEYWLRGCTVEQNAMGILERDGGYFEYTTCDPSASAGRAMLLENGIPTLAVRSNLMQGIQDVKEMLKDKKLLIAENCEKTIKEFNLYKYEPPEETSEPRPEREHDHAMDAVRYFIVNWRRGYIVDKDKRNWCRSMIERIRGWCGGR